MDSSTSGTGLLVRVGSGVSYFHQRRTTDADNPTRPMTTKIETLQQQVLDLSKTLEVVHQTLQQVSKELKSELACEDFDVFVQKEIAPYFGESTAENIVKMLKRCRTNGNCYVYFNPVYQWKGIHGDLQKRQLLKLVSAVYRVKYHPKGGNNVYSLRSDIKYAKACPECGAIAATFYDRLVKEGIM